MKQKLLLALLALFTLGGGNLCAQTWTDKTPVITNPSFEEDDPIADLKGCGWATDRVNGWTIAPSSPGNSQVGVGSSSSTIQGIAASFNPSDGDKYFYMRENWNPNTTFSISQKISAGIIPAGFYRLTVKVAMFSSVASTYTLSLQEGGQTAATNSFSYAGTANNENWRDWSVVLYKQSDDTDLTITAAYKTPSENSGGKHYCMLLDDVKLEYVAPSSVSSTNTFDITDFIKNPGFDNNSGDGWTMTTTYTNWGANAISNGNKQQWNGNFSVSQELPKLPNGVYELGVQGFYRPGGNDSQSTDKNAVLFAVGNQEVTSPLMLVSAGGSASKDDTNGYTTAYTGVDPNVYVPNSQGDAEKAFGANGYSDNSLRVIVTDGSLTIGVKKETLINNDWTVIDNFSLKYLGTDLLLAEVIAAWETAHAALADLDADALPTAAKNAITEELAKDLPDTEERIVAATAAMQALIDSYEGIKAAYNEYKALKDKVEDLKNTNKYTFTGNEALSTFNSTLSEISGNVETATNAETINNLLPNLKAAGNTFVANIESTDGFDLTYNIVNNSFETGGLSPWTTNGSNDTGVKPNINETYTTTGVDGAYLFNTWNNGAGSKVSQTILNLPEGYYTVTALVASDADKKITIMAGSSNKEVTTSDKGTFVEGITDKTLVSEGSLEIGANSSTWYKADYFRLTYYTVKSGAAEAWIAAKIAAEEAIADEAYDNVTGEERSALQAEIEKEEPTTAEAYGIATTALQEATTNFKDAKAAYDAFVAASNIDMPDLAYVSEDKRQQLNDACSAEPNTAAEAETATANITTALRAFYESHAMAESVTEAVNMTNDIADWNPDSNKGWTNGIGVDNRDNEKYTDASGNPSGNYYDGGWSTNAGVNINMTREVNVPAGKYLLTVTARGSSSLTEYKMTVGENAVDLPKNGSGVEVGVFGHGWDDVSLEFESEGTPLTLSIIATSTDYQQWISFNRFRLVQLEANNNVYAGEEEYAALNEAIAAAEAKTLGFDEGEYAPYNNVAALQALAAAKAIDQTAELTNLKTDVQAAIDAIADNKWTANTEEVNAVHNSMFATVQEGANYPEGWNRTNAWGQMQSNIAGDYATAYYNQPGSLKYGENGVYTMPLKENTAYVLNFAYRSHENNSNNGVTVSVLNGEEGLSNKVFEGNGSTTEWKTATVYFTTGAAGNYVLTLANNGNTWMTNVSIFRAVAEEVELRDAATEAPAETYANVTYNRQLLEGWNSLVLPFDVTKEELGINESEAEDGERVLEYKGTEKNGESDYTLNFDRLTEDVLAANTPYMIKKATDGTNMSFAGKIISPVAEPKVADEAGAYDFVGTYVAIEKDENKIKAGDLTVGASQLNKAKAAKAMKAFRAFFRCVLPAEEALNARITVNIDGQETDAITAVEIFKTMTEGIYNLQGQKVNKAQKGIYIVNGKKVVIK